MTTATRIAAPVASVLAVVALSVGIAPVAGPPPRGSVTATLDDPEFTPVSVPEYVAPLALATERTVLDLGGAPAPREIEIPRIGVRSKIVPVRLSSDGEIGVPRPEVAGWFDGSVSPGEIGPSIVVGHIDSQTGPAVFYALSRLRAGDDIRVERADGSVARFRVVDLERYRKSRVPPSLYGMSSVPELRLVTCGGPFSRGSYRDNVVVYAVAA